MKIVLSGDFEIEDAGTGEKKNVGKGDVLFFRKVSWIMRTGDVWGGTMD